MEIITTKPPLNFQSHGAGKLLFTGAKPCDRPGVFSLIEQGFGFFIFLTPVPDCVIEVIRNNEAGLIQLDVQEADGNGDFKVSPEDICLILTNIKKVIDCGVKVYMCCDAGARRSPLIAADFLRTFSQYQNSA